MLNERRVSRPYRRTSANEDDAVGELGKHIRRIVVGSDLANGAVLEGKLRDRGIGARAGDDHMAFGHVEEPCHIGNILATLVALPRESAVQPELPALAYGAHGANMGHAVLPCCDGNDLTGRWRLGKDSCDKGRPHDSPPAPPP